MVYFSKLADFFDFTILPFCIFADLKALKSLIPYFVKYRWRLLLGIVFVSVANYFAVYSITFVRQGIDYVKDASTNTPISTIGYRLMGFGLMTLGVSLLQGLFMFLMRQSIIVMCRHIEYDQKNALFEKLQQFDPESIKHYTIGDLMNRMSEDIGRVRMFTGPSIMYLVNTLMTFSFTIGIMLKVNTELTLLVLSPLPILAISIYFVSSRMNKRSQIVQEHLSAISTMVQETFAGVRVVKSFGKENLWISRFRQKTKDYRKVNLDLVMTNSLFQPSVLLLIGLSAIITIYMGGRQAIQGKVSIGNIAEFLVYVSRLAWPIASLGWVTSLIQRAAASQTRIDEVMHFQPAIQDGKLEMVNEFETIVFKNVTVHYPNTQKTALKNASFCILKGQKIGIVGKTGAGKSTIINLLTRHLDPTSGEILLNGQQLTHYKIASWRNKLGVVPQESFLFSETIAENVSFSYPTQKAENTKSELQIKEKVGKSLEMAEVKQSIDKFPLKEETLVGERGVLLSGGQKQRIAIARAFYKDPQVFMFDDCLSAVDTITENQILTNIRTQFSKKTLIVVSHKISTVMDANCILFVENGEIKEIGTHASLMAAQNGYYQMYQIQQL